MVLFRSLHKSVYFSFFLSLKNKEGEGGHCSFHTCVFFFTFASPSPQVFFFFFLGALRIIDRKKAIFKLAQGEYIAPEKIENVYVRAPSVAQIFVYGHSLESTLVAVAVPDMENMPQWLPANVPSLSVKATAQEICAHPEVRAKIMVELVEAGKAGGLQSFEQVRKLCMEPEPFSVENGLLTPTFKAKRPQLQERFKQQIEKMYQDIHRETSAGGI